MKDLEDVLAENFKRNYHNMIMFGGRSYGKSKYLDTISERITKMGFTVKRVKTSK